MGYLEAIEEKCKGCKYHKVLMCDADVVASYCGKNGCWSELCLGDKVCGDYKAVEE